MLAWCKEKKIQTPLENMTVGQIDANLRRFYPEARKKDGEMYSKKTLLGFRHAIERFLNLPPLSRNVKFSSDPRLKRSNEMLDAQLVNLKRSGKDNTQHKPIIEDEDLMKLKSSEALSLKSPLSLLRNVWLHVVLFFCRRGREGQRQLSKSSFKSEIDAAGRNYFTMAHDEASKNHPGGIKDVSSTEKFARMYESNHQNDGYKALSLYLSKLNPQCAAFFQYPKKNWAPDDAVWFENKPLGVNKLDGMMKEISQAARLSRLYTNHSVRATAITLWSNAGVPNRHIMAISGHRNEQILVHYNTRPSSAQLHHCSDVLAQSLDRGSSAIVPSQPSVQLTIAVQQNNLVLSAVQAKPPLYFDSIFKDCTIQNMTMVVSSANNE